MSGLSQSDLVTDDLLDDGEGEIAGTCCVSDASACGVPASSNSSNNNDDDDSSCFSGESPVSLADGSSKAMADVVVGDQVKVVTADGQVSFSEVVFVPHAANSVKSQFVHLHTASGSSLSVTCSHIAHGDGRRVRVHQGRHAR